MIGTDSSRNRHARGGVLTDEPISDTHRHNLIRSIKAAVKWAYDDEIIDRLPLKKLKGPAATSRQFVLSEKQYATILEMTGEILRDVVIVLRETGCRPQELRKVEARHFDREQRCWIFPAKEAKGGKHPRFVALSDNAFAITARLAEKYPTGPLFRNSAGKPWIKDLLGRCFAYLQKKVGFPVTAYTFRHSFATWAVKGGKVDILSLAATMGHRDTRMLAKVYAHVGDAKHLHDTLAKALGKDSAA